MSKGLDLFSVCQSGKVSTSVIYSMAFQLSQSKNLTEFWEHFFHLCREDFGWIGCCIVFMDETSMRVESSSFHDKSFERKPDFFQLNPKVLEAIGGGVSVNLQAQELEIPLNDEFLSCWLPTANFDHLFIHPFTSFKEQRAAVIVASPYLHENKEQDWKDLVALFLLLSIQLYEKLLIEQTLDQSNKLILSEEKCATLGHLTAGIAHEMNSPLGAINAASCNVKESQSKLMNELKDILNLINSENKEPFFFLLNLAIEPKEFLSSRDERIKKREIRAKLEEEGLGEADNYADILVDMGIYQDVSEQLKQLKENLPLFISFIFNFAGIERNNDNIVHAVDRAIKMISAVKSYSKNEESPEMRLNSIKEGVETVLTLYQHDLKNEIALITNLQDVPLVVCNQDELYQVWTNLIFNALHAMDHKGTLEINTYQDGESVVVSFSDTGSGIDQNIQHRIFEPYFTTKPRGQGSGLGLDIVKKIINKHGGTIDFASQPGATTFFVRLPIKAEI